MKLSETGTKVLEYAYAHRKSGLSCEIPDKIVNQQFNIDYTTFIACIEYLQGKNYIKESGNGAGYMFFDITSEGVDFLESIS